MAQILLPTREAPKQEKQQETALDKLVKGLQVAGNVFGIASDISSLKTQSQARDIAAAREAREAGKYGIEMQRTTLQAPEGAPGTELGLKTPEGEQVTQLRVPKPEPVGPDGRPKAPITTAEVRQRDLERKIKEELEDDAKKHTATIQKVGFPSIVAAMKKADAAIEASIAKDNDIAGFGATGMSPQATLSKEGKDVRVAVESLKNQLLKARSGAAVTDQEAKRFLEEVGTNPFMKDEDLVRGLNLIRANIAENLATFEVGMEPDALALLRSQREKRGLAGKLTPSIFSDDDVFQQKDFRPQLEPDQRDAIIAELKRRQAATAQTQPQR